MSATYVQRFVKIKAGRLLDNEGSWAPVRLINVNVTDIVTCKLHRTLPHATVNTFVLSNSKWASRYFESDGQACMLTNACSTYYVVVELLAGAAGAHHHSTRLRDTLCRTRHCTTDILLSDRLQSSLTSSKTVHTYHGTPTGCRHAAGTRACTSAADASRSCNANPPPRAAH